MKKLLAALLLWCGVSYADIIPGEVTCSVSPCTIYNQAFIHILTGDKFGLSWSCNTTCNGPDTEYVLETRRFPPVATDVPVASAVVAYDKNVWQTSLSRAGMYYQRIMSCYIGKRDAASCSVWVNTYDLQTATGAKFPRGFVLEAKLKAPTL